MNGLDAVLGDDALRSGAVRRCLGAVGIRALTRKLEAVLGDYSSGSQASRIDLTRK